MIETMNKNPNIVLGCSDYCLDQCFEAEIKGLNKLFQNIRVGNKFEL